MVKRYTKIKNEDSNREHCIKINNNNDKPLQLYLYFSYTYTFHVQVWLEEAINYNLETNSKIDGKKIIIC